MVAQLFRVAAKDFTLGDYTVPAGQHMLLPLKFVADRDARWAGEDGELAPSAFVPERMMTPEGLKQGAQLPFGYGPRCAGAQGGTHCTRSHPGRALTRRAAAPPAGTAWVQGSHSRK